MEIKRRFSSIPMMLDYLEGLKSGMADRRPIAEILDHPDYDFEIRRYGVSSRAALIDYFQRLDSIDPDDILALCPERASALRDRHPLWIEAYQNPGKYRALYEDTLRLLTDGALEDAYALARAGLPPRARAPVAQVVSTMSIGPSFGYVFEGALHFDLMGIGVYCEPAELLTVIAHELHHIAMWDYAKGFIGEFSPEERYIFGFSGEGLAIKFCNNAQGTVSKPIYADRPADEGLDARSMAHLNSRFFEALGVFADTLKGIRSGELTGADIQAQYERYWWNPNPQGQVDAPLLQTLVYSFGNDLYGAIYDAFGAQALFECVRHPLKAVERFRRAAQMAGADIDAFFEGL